MVQVVEPLRAFDGKCGRPNNNATCVGTDKQCCNAQTWTCGDSEADCAPGTCYEGVCAGDLIYSTDGTCGQDHGLRSCTGRWGNCCSYAGQCGTGPAYCGLFNCQEGDCDIWKEDQQPEGTPWTPDGTCGGTDGYRCSSDWGRCCNVNGVCGESPADCYLERGCQSAFGICASNSTTDPASSSTIPASFSSTAAPPINSIPISSTSSPTSSTSAATPTEFQCFNPLEPEHDVAFFSFTTMDMTQTYSAATIFVSDDEVGIDRDIHEISQAKREETPANNPDEPARTPRLRPGRRTPEQTYQLMMAGYGRRFDIPA